VIAERGDLLSEESCMRLMLVWPVLKAATERRSGLSMAQWVERTWRSLGGDAYLRDAEMANARRYLQVLDDVEEQAGNMDMALLKRRLGKLFAETVASADAVDLMTIHGAKGLEWDVVIVPGLEKKAQGNREKLLTWNEIDSGDAETAHIMLAPIVGRGEGSRELNDWLKGIDKAREAAERKRLFYVACTRAREELHLFASPEATTKGEISRPYGSLLATTWPAAERHFATAPATSKNPMFVMSLAPDTEENFVGDIAAGEELVRPAIVQRLPSVFEPGVRFIAKQKLSYGEDPGPPALAHFERPNGSFEARAFGNAVHAFLEMLTKQLADGTSPEALVREVAGWSPRIAALLRGDGLPPVAVERLVTRVKTALINTLQDTDGLWVLSNHDEASSEYALTSWNDRRSSVRLDRVFLAGAEPLNAGNDYIWIIDYKTSTHGREGVDGFLAEERVKYGPQMEAYGRMIQDRVQSGKLRVGLYYPALSRLIWWQPELISTDTSD
jgi:ATP-dependent helicase/nuclease subunit A